MTDAKILVVEDEIITARAIEEALKRWGYDVPSAVSSGLEAIEKAAEIQPDLVLMDIVLKGDMDGIEAAEQIRSRFDIPVVYLTAYTDSETVQRAKITEPFGYITKPFEEKQLFTIIEMALYKHKIDKALRKSESEKQLILSTLSELIVYHDKNLRIVWANRAAGEAAGRPTNQMVGHYCYEIWHGRREPCVGCPVTKSIEIGEPQDGEITTPDGRIWDICANPVRDEKGEVTGVVGTTLDITQRKRAEEKLLDYQAQLKSLTSELLLVEERERRRLARAVHDNIGQELVLAKMELQSSMESTMGPDAMGILDKVCKLLDKVMQDVHSLTFELSSPLLYEVGLVAAVEQWLAEEIRKKHGIKYKLSANVKSKAFDHELNATVFRVVRELLINVIKHAKAKNIRVGIKELKGALSVAIEDDGVGFDVAKFAKALRKGKKTKFGLFSAKEQLEFLGGKFRIESVPKKGTKVSMTIPLRTEDR